MICDCRGPAIVCMLVLVSAADSVRVAELGTGVRDLVRRDEAFLGKM